MASFLQMASFHQTPPMASFLQTLGHSETLLFPNNGFVSTKHSGAPKHSSSRTMGSFLQNTRALRNAPLPEQWVRFYKTLVRSQTLLFPKQWLRFYKTLGRSETLLFPNNGFVFTKNSGALKHHSSPNKTQTEPEALAT
jgi:hypothetical protein